MLLRYLVLAVIFLAGLGTWSAEAGARRLNVLLITADDLGLQLGCYGEKRIPTPHLDRLASQGARFEVAYVAQASCSPSRSAMFTGLHTHSTGQYGLTGAGFALHPHLRDKTLPNILKRAGYRTGIIGKLHVAPEDSFQFDYRPKVNTRKVRTVATAAERFLDSVDDSPFFLMVNYSDPHAFRHPKNRRKWYFPPQVDGLPENPVQPSAETLFDFQQIDTPQQRERTAGFLNAVQRLDVGVGMLMDVLSKHGHGNNTLVIFVGDHGPPFTRGKTTVYEAGLRIPFLVRWPGVSKPIASPAMVSTIDILPTILDATGVPATHAMHGKSLRPVVSHVDAPWREYLVGEFHFHGKPFFPRRAIRDGRYKLIHNLLAGKARPTTGIDGDPAYQVSRRPEYNGTAVRRAFDTLAHPPEYELYDLQKDPVEFRNLAGRPEYAEIQTRLTEALLRYLRQTDDPFLDPDFVARFLDK